MKIYIKMVQGKIGNAFRGEVLEDDVLVGSFTQRSPRSGYYPMVIKFRTDGAQNRFKNLARGRSTQETIEAMLGK